MMAVRNSEFNDASGAQLSSEELRAKLDGYYLIRAYRVDAGPYAVVTDLPFDEAVAACEASDPNRGLDDPAASGGRDQAAYMTQRIKTETWLRENASATGVEIAKSNPAYFAFTREPDRVLGHMAGRDGMAAVAFRADEIDLSNWSFTLDDHFFASLDDADKGGAATLDGYDAHPLHGRVMNAFQLVSAIEEFGYPDDELKHNFEAQMWAASPTTLDAAAAPAARSLVQRNLG